MAEAHAAPRNAKTPASIALTSLYALAYESMQQKYGSDKIQDEYNAIQSSVPSILSPKTVPSSPEQLLERITNLVEGLSSNDPVIYGWIEAPIEAEETKQAEKLGAKKSGAAQTTYPPRATALVKYCESDNLDQALLCLLHYKLGHDNSAKELVNFRLDNSAGWSSYQYAAIHKAIEKCTRSERSYQHKDDMNKRFEIEKIPYDADEATKEALEAKNKPKEERRDAYIRSVVDSKYDRTILLIEFILREGATTTLISHASGWRVHGGNKTVFDMALASNNMDVLRAIFKYGTDIDINTQCSSGGSTMRTDYGETWQPIHTSIEQKNYELTKLIIGRGADINAYRTYTMNNEYGSRQDKQRTALYCICSEIDDGNRMLKLILSEHQQKYNGIPDVNKFNCFVSSDSKPKEVYREQRLAMKRQQRAERSEHGDGGDADATDANADVDDENFDEDEWDDPRSGYYVNPHVNMNNYETCMHAAVAKCDLEMIKLLLIHGADISLCKLKTKSGAGGGYGFGRRDKNTDRNQAMRTFHDAYMKTRKATENKPMSTNEYDRMQSVYDILAESKKGGEDVKAQIRRIFDTRSIWFPEMLSYYPNKMGEALKVIIDSLKEELPEVMINIVIEYFYNIIEQDAIKEADKDVDITNDPEK